ncbi:DNA repair exonuclease [Paenibacillus sp. NFR01]|uniref:metallophosphoesterase family protein n=1 Tax=Paenibacillus sp. NFR01 TaxID=1566279 RepID=UPI0008D002CB|nr:DNA repair exonuclease [Paenibacillus sp. NFR01]SET02018.1 DNA repair exonuclease SbcCD nuclease subunit [Paenibacillus sp. NFR01]
MIPFRFLHAADLHLDSRFAGMSQVSPSVRSYLRESAFAALGRLVGVAVSERVDFVVISGDVYDVSDASLQGQLRFREALEQFDREGIPVYLIHGNHDPLDGPRLKTPYPPSVTVFGADEPGRTIARRRSDGQEVAVISGISYPTMKVTDNTALKFSRLPGSGLYHIAMLHANVGGDPQHETYSPCTLGDLIGRDYDYWALGHIHKREVLHERPWIVYPGNIQGRSVKETGAKGCYIVDVDEGGFAQLRFHELDSVRWMIRELPVDGFTREEEWIGAVEREIETLRDEHPRLFTAVRFRLTGRGELHRLLSEQSVVDDLLAELRRREVVRAEQGQYAGLVWVEGFAVESGLPFDRERLLEEDSFLGELLRYTGASAGAATDLDDLLGAAMKPLLENRELRALLSSVTAEEKRNWLSQAAELAVALLGDAGTGGMLPEEAGVLRGRDMDRFGDNRTADDEEETAEEAG